MPPSPLTSSKSTTSSAGTSITMEVFPAVVSSEQYERLLEAAEHAEDLESSDAVMAETKAVGARASAATASFM